MSTAILTPMRFLISVSVMVFFSIAAPAQTISPEQKTATQAVIKDQLSAFQTGDHDRAFSHAAPSIKKMFRSTENFIRMVESGYNALYASDGYFFARNRTDGTTIFQEVIATDQSGKQWQAIYSLQLQDNGSWKITGVQMNPYTGSST